MSSVSLKRLFMPAFMAVVIGPLIWGILVVLFVDSMVLRDVGTAVFVNPQIIGGFAVTGPIYVAASYYFGAPIALIAGLLVGVAWISGHPPNLFLAIAAALFATVIWEIVTWWFFDSGFYPIASAMFGVAAVLGATSCWFLLRRYVGRI